MPIEAWDAHDPAELDPEALGRAYGEAVRDTADAADSDEFRTELSDSGTLTAIREGDGGGVTIDDAAVILASGADRRDPSSIRAELFDRLLIGMTNAVLDVDTLANEVALDLSGKELQQRIEGRVPMTLAEYAHIRHAIARRTP